MINVLQFITPSGFYGAERWVLALANNIDSQHIVCDLAVSDEGGNQDISISDYYPKRVGKIHRVKMKGRFDLRSIIKLRRIVKERQIDIIHTHGYKSDILGGIVARLCGISSVSTPHGFSGDVDLKLRFFIKLGVFMLRFFDAVVPLSEELCADMKRMKVPKKKVFLVHNGVDLKEVDSSVGDSYGTVINDTPALTIGFIGQMIPRKGISDLLDIFDALYEENPTLKLKLVGDGVQRKELETYASKLSSADAIEFLGFRNDRLQLLSTFDLFLMTSSLEGIPRCMMEAMAVGTPVVAYNIPGVSELIENDVTGLSAPYGDKSALARACLKTLEQKEESARRARNARDLIERKYSAKRMAQEYQKIYQALVTRHKVRSHNSGRDVN